MRSASISTFCISIGCALLLLLLLCICICISSSEVFAQPARTASNINNRKFDASNIPEPGGRERPRDQDPEIDERIGGQGYIAPRYRRAMLSALEAEKTLYRCRYAGGAMQRIKDLECFLRAIDHFNFNATWFKQAAITARVGGFVNQACSLWNSSLYTVMEARGYISKKLKFGDIEPVMILQMMHRTRAEDAREMAKVWIEVLISEGKLRQARQLVEEFLLPAAWQDLSTDLAGEEGNRGTNRSWIGELQPVEAGEIYRQLLSPADAAAAQSFMNKQADIVRRRAAVRKKRRAREEERRKNKKKPEQQQQKGGDVRSEEDLGIAAVNPGKPLEVGDAAGLSFTALLAEQIAMTAELLIRDTLQSTSLVKSQFRKRGREEFEQTQRRMCGRAFYARAGGIVRWMNAVRYVEECVLKWKYLQSWMQRDNTSEMLIKQYPGFHSISRAETHLYAQLGTAKLLTLVLNFTGPPGGAIQDAMKQTPLHLAASAGHKETVAIIMGFGVSPTLPDIGKVQPLYHLCRHPHLKKLLEEGMFSLPDGAPQDLTLLCRDKHVSDMLLAAQMEAANDERADDVDDSGGGWRVLLKRKEGQDQKCDKRIEMRSINAINENDFAARYASGSEPVVLRSEFPNLQKLLQRKALAKQSADATAAVAEARKRREALQTEREQLKKNKAADAARSLPDEETQRQKMKQDPLPSPYADDLEAQQIKLRVEVTPDAEKFGSGLARNMTVGEFLSLLDRRGKEPDAAAASSSGSKPLFGVVEVTEEHPWGRTLWGTLVHDKAVTAVRDTLSRWISQQSRTELEMEEEENNRMREQQEDNVAAQKKKKGANGNNKKLTKSEQLGELFRPPFAPRNRTSAASMAQSFFSPVSTASVHICETGAVSNLVTTFVGRIHAAIHGEQQIVLLPPPFAVTTKNPVSAADFDQRQQVAKDIADSQEGWHDKVMLKCVLLPGDVLFVPPFWAFGFESHNGESVSVTGRITWR